MKGADLNMCSLKWYMIKNDKKVLVMQNGASENIYASGALGDINRMLIVWHLEFNFKPAFL